MVATNISRLSIVFLLILIATAIQSSTAEIAPHRTLLAAQRNNRRQQIPSCSEMVTRSQCFQNPKCRWCKSEVLDDMCFSKIEARRLPQQVFLCD